MIKNEARHDVRISKLNAKKLNILKATLDMKTHNDVITELIEHYNQTKKVSKS